MGGPSLPTQALLVVISPPGGGRTSRAIALAELAAAQGETTLVVQWTVRDAISPRFGLPPTGHAHQQISPRIFTMNFSPEDSLREYFVEHLHMGVFHRLMLENQAVSDLVRGVPGLAELCFFGRTCWLFEHAEKDLGERFDRVIVDAPSERWVTSVFEMFRAIVSSGIGGPIDSEARHVLSLIDDPARCVVLRDDTRPSSGATIDPGPLPVRSFAEETAPAPVNPAGSRAPRVHVVVGAGGAGKTTIARALAHQMAHGGAHVALLSLEPNATPESTDATTTRVGQGSIVSACFDLARVIHRWIDEADIAKSDVTRIHANPLFRIARDHVPSTSLAFAPAWIAELLEDHAEITDVVLDAPSGLALAELLRRPERFARFADGRVVGLFRKGANHTGLTSPLGWIAAQGARGVLAAVGAASGEGVLQAMGDLLVTMTPVLDLAIDRIHLGLALLEGASTHALIVTQPRATAEDDVDALHELLALHHITSTTVIVSPLPSTPTSVGATEQLRSFCTTHAIPIVEVTGHV